MTWEQIAEIIAKMTPAERKKMAKFAESWDDGQCHSCLTLEKATRPIPEEWGRDIRANGEKSPIAIRKGEYYFW